MINKNLMLIAFIYGAIGAALLLGTLALGQQMSKGTSADPNEVLRAGILIAGVVLYGAQGAIHPRKKRKKVSSAS